MRPRAPVFLALAMLFLSAVAGESPPAPKEKEVSAMTLTLTTPAFAAGGAIPRRHTCDGEDISPELRWTDPPAGTAAFALVANDPDAPVGDWVHWVIYDLPGSLRALPEGLARDATLAEPKGARQGVNDFGRAGWGGPCPPPGKPHRYFFRLFALDAPTGQPPGARRADVERAIEGHVLARAEIHGSYARAGR